MPYYLQLNQQYTKVISLAQDDTSVGELRTAAVGACNFAGGVDAARTAGLHPSDKDLSPGPRSGDWRYCPRIQLMTVRDTGSIL
jgi:hypothetical protein